MDFFFLVFLAALVFGIGFFLALAYAFHVRNALSEVSFAKDSQSVKYGKLSEQWIPFSERFPYSRENFRFIGSPIDGIAFEDEKIVFVEFKSNSSPLSRRQENVKRLVNEKRVEWFELRAK
ncbi:MAG: endonuclease [Candidatus Diapherotrites archaeon]|nr:endonuclease [Candidatus Diapherotrites archaeon]